MSSVDFHLLELSEDVEIGHSYRVSPSLAVSDMFIDSASSSCGLQGVCRAVAPHQELLLLAFFDARDALNYDLWIPIECAQKTTRSALGHTHLDTEMSEQLLKQQLDHHSTLLTALYARRAIYNLQSRSTRCAQALFAHQLAIHHDIASLFHNVMLSVSESLQLTSLDQLGQCEANKRQSLSRLEYNSIRFLESQLSNEESCKLLLSLFCRLVRSAALAVNTQSFVSPFSIASTGTARRLTHSVSVSGASLLILLFDRSSRLSKDSQLFVHSDEAMTRLVRSYAGSKADKSAMPPAVVPHHQATITVTRSSDIQSRGAAIVIPVMPQLGIALWLADLLLSRRLAHIAGQAQGGAAGLTFHFIQSLMSEFGLVGMTASPLKEMLLRSVSKYLLTAQRIAKKTELKQRQALQDFESSDALEQKLVSPPPAEEYKSALVSSSNSVQSDCLLSLAKVGPIFEREFKSASVPYTSLVQQLLDVIIVSDLSRPSRNRVVPPFILESAQEKAIKIQKAKIEAEEAANKPYACSVCTVSCITRTHTRTCAQKSAQRG